MSRKGQLGENTYAGENPPSVLPVEYQTRDRMRLVNTPLITFYLGSAASGTASLEVTNPDGASRTVSIPAKPGITRYAWDLRSAAAAAAAAAAAEGGEEGRLPVAGLAVQQAAAVPAVAVEVAAARVDAVALRRRPRSAACQAYTH